VARLRIAVFRAFPYLYDGDLDYERRYLEPYRSSPGAIVVGAFDGDRLVGAATGTPMEDHAEDFAAAFAGTGMPLGHLLLRRKRAAARLSRPGRRTSLLRPARSACARGWAAPTSPSAQ
jgi:hypothetical protein